MDSEVVKKAEIVLSNNELLTEFAALNRMSAGTAKALLARLVCEPVFSGQAERDSQTEGQVLPFATQE
ncbi:MAG: hypothetical protein R6V43_13360 [Halopseudomonas sp.]